MVGCREGCSVVSTPISTDSTWIFVPSMSLRWDISPLFSDPLRIYVWILDYTPCLLLSFFLIDVFSSPFEPEPPPFPLHCIFLQFWVLSCFFYRLNREEMFQLEVNLLFSFNSLFSTLSVIDILEESPTRSIPCIEFEQVRVGGDIDEILSFLTDRFRIESCLPEKERWRSDGIQAQLEHFVYPALIYARWIHPRGFVSYLDVLWFSSCWTDSSLS